jgi:hypothetical protein
VPDRNASPAARRRTTAGLASAIVLVLVTSTIALAVRASRDGDDSPPTAGPTTSGAPPATIPRTTTTTGPAASPLSPDQARTVDRLQAQVTAIRGLEWKSELPIRIVSPDELDRRIRDLTAIEREKDPDEEEATEAALALLQLIPRDLDLTATIDRLLEGGVLGFYDDEAKELYVGGDPDEDLDLATQSTMVHELAHALTDQHFDFGTRNKTLSEQELAEESFALAALLEGDAELVRLLWAQTHLTSRQQLEAELGGTGDPFAYVDVPPYLLDSLFFPYQNGLDFVTALHDQGGFAAVDEAYRQPPTSTEEILHPDRYRPGGGWARPPLPDLAAATGCAEVDVATVGEFDMTQILDRHLPQAEARRAAMGWNGDAYVLVRCGTALGLADRWQADSPSDLAELADSLARWAGGWSGSDRAPDGNGNFSGPSGAGRIVRAGDRVDLVIADDASTSERLVAALSAA